MFHVKRTVGLSKEVRGSCHGSSSYKDLASRAGCRQSLIHKVIHSNIHRPIHRAIDRPLAKTRAGSGPANLAWMQL